MRATVRIVRAAPMTVALLLAIWALAVATDALRRPLPPEIVRRWGSGGAALVQHQWWTPLTSALLAWDLSGYLVITALLVGCGFAEARLGLRRTLVLLVSGQVSGCVAAAAIALATGPTLLWPVDVFHGRALGLGPGLYAVAAGLTASMRVLWRRRIRVGVFTFLVVQMLYSGHLSDLQNVVGALAGLAIGGLMSRTSRPVPPRRLVPSRRPVPPRRLVPSLPSRRETRILVTAVLLATTLAPAVSSLRVRPGAPTTDATQLLVTSVPAPTAVRTVCARPNSAQLCHILRQNVHSPRPAELLLAALPVLLILVFANGLRRGRRAAWWGALVSQALLSAVIVVDLLRAPAPGQLVVPAAVLLIPGVGLVAMLVATRGAFAQRAHRGTSRRALLVIGGVFGVAVAGHCIALTILAADFVPTATTGGAIVDFFARIAPTPLVARPALVPASPLAATVAAVTAPAFWIILLVILLRTFWSKDRDIVEPEEHREARTLLRRHGGGTLSYPTMWPGQRIWFNAAKNVYVAYRRCANVALTTGAPVGDPAAVPDAVAEFAAFCDQRGWIACFYAVDGELADRYRALDWRTLYIGDDAQIDLTKLRFTGRRWQDVRTAIHRASRTGVRAEWCLLTQVPPAILDQVRLMSEEWLAEKGLPEMGFTLGGVDEALDENVRCLLAIDGDGRVHAITSWLPVHREGRVVGWTLDLMRRRADSMPGVMEFLIATAATAFQCEDVALMSLSGTPLAFVDGSASGGAAHRLMAGAGRILEPVYGFRSLLAFKAKFQPVYRPLYLTYPQASALPAIGNAIGRAYLPHVTWRQLLRILAAALARNSSTVDSPPPLALTPAGDTP
jgi:phosphatidylglycerol lysyltransferase